MERVNYVQAISCLLLSLSASPINRDVNVCSAAKLQNIYIILLISMLNAVNQF